MKNLPENDDPTVNNITTATLSPPPLPPQRTSTRSTATTITTTSSTKHLFFHSATKCETKLLFLSFLLKGDFGILKVYGGGERSHGDAGRSSPN